MRDREHINLGECIQIDTTQFSIAETQSGYTLYASVGCTGKEEGKEAWAASGGSVPEGWKPCSSAIPANTQHNVYDVVPGTVFYLKDCTDNVIYYRQ